MAFSRENLISAAIGGIAGLICALGVIALHTRMGGLEAGDILGFFGALIGTALAVAGAVWIEERKRKVEIEAGAAPVLDALMSLERKSRDFFDSPGQRKEFAGCISHPMDLLFRLLPLAPPRTTRHIALFDRLRAGAEMLTGGLYLMMDEQASMEPDEQRARVEAMLESFDIPLKLLIVDYSRMVDPKAARSVRELKMPEI